MNLFQWLGDEAKSLKTFRIIFLSVPINLLIVMIMATLLSIMGLLPENSKPIGIPILTWFFPVFLFLAALFEELIFRLLPLLVGIAILHGYDIEEKSSYYPRLILMFSAAIIFGYAHGSWVNIFLQGFAGLVFSLVWLKCGGLQKRWVKATLCSTLAHALYNGAIALIIISQGGTAL